MDKILNYINGKFVEPGDGSFFENINPALGKTYGLVPDSGAKDVDAAVRAAAEAFPLWSKTSAKERSHWLMKLAAALHEEFESFARAESVDSGKPISLSKALDIPRSQQNLEFFAQYISDLKGEVFRSEKNGFNTTSYSPLGVVGCISPWNLPLYLFTWKIAPALVSGNTVVAKPSEITPMTAYMLSRLCEKVGLPPGVLNVVHGTGPKVGAPLVAHPQVKAISFTGSTASGRAIAENAAPGLKRVALEMGGKNPNIIFADCDFEKTVAGTVRSSFLNQGQVCLCGSRIFVERSVYAKFRDTLAERAASLRQGDPLDEKTEQGAVVSEAHMKKVLSYLDIAGRQGKIITGGRRASVSGPFSSGFFIQPTLIENLPPSHRVNQEEIFGPVASLIPFEKEEDLVAMANSTRYGLSASLWTQDIRRAERIASQLESGTVWINTWMLRDLRVPFGGVKDSGLGREGGLEALKFFSEVKNICMVNQ